MKTSLLIGLQALNETAREDAEWILWMDLDTVAVESDIAFPLADYEGKDLVLWIQPDLVLQGDAFRKPPSLLSCSAIFFRFEVCLFFSLSVASLVNMLLMCSSIVYAMLLSGIASQAWV